MDAHRNRESSASSGSTVFSGLSSVTDLSGRPGTVPDISTIAEESFGGRASEASRKVLQSIGSETVVLEAESL